MNSKTTPKLHQTHPTTTPQSHNGYTLLHESALLKLKQAGRDGLTLRQMNNIRPFKDRVIEARNKLLEDLEYMELAFKRVEPGRNGKGKPKTTWYANTWSPVSKEDYWRDLIAAFDSRPKSERASLIKRLVIRYL